MKDEPYVGPVHPSSLIPHPFRRFDFAFLTQVVKIAINSLASFRSSVKRTAATILDSTSN